MAAGWPESVQGREEDGRGACLSEEHEYGDYQHQERNDCAQGA